MLVELKVPSLSAELVRANQSIVALLEVIAEASDEDVKPILKTWTHPKHPTKKSIKGVLRLSPEQRCDLLAAVRHDIGFEAYRTGGSFEFQFQSLEPEVRKAGKKLLCSMYDQVFRSEGFKLDDSSLVNRRSWEQAVRDANGELELCPACLMSIWEEPVDDRSMADLDHFLPKAIYPQLAVHGLNLVPLCKDCNSPVKGQQDPLTPGKGRLPSIWFPYEAAGIEEADLVFQVTNEITRTVTLKGNPGYEDKAINFDRLFKVSTRWSRRLNAIHAAVHQDLKTDFPPGTPRDPAAIQAKLKTMAENKRALVIRSPENYLGWKYCEWLALDQAHLEDLIASLP
ncbi:MAG TPA: hypothetical protein VGW80_08815 [Solirubrobacterales bacterium]|jgi:hypothetical protein|nr:hypothetical protein [Solirubrobacterales bacterium]